MRAAFAFVRLAGRNVLRNRSRSALTLGAILFGVLLTVVLAGFGNGLSTLMVDDIVNAKIGALQVHRHGWADQQENQPLELDMPAGGELVARLRAVPGVAAVAPRLVFAGLISNGSDATMFVGRGVDPAAELETLPWSRRDVEGQPITAQAPHAGVIGRELAEGLNAKPGATLTMQATTRNGQQNALDLDVAGTLAEANAFEVKRLVMVPLAFAQELLRMPGRATEFVVRPAAGTEPDDLAAALRAALGPDYDVQTWRQAMPTFADLIAFQRVVIRIVSAVFLVIVVFGVANTMVMSVFERTREIGTMMALGLRRGRIGALFLIEAAFLAAAGALAGAVGARALVALLTRTGGFPIAAPGTTVARYHLVPVIPPGITGAAVTAAIAGALLAALYPAWKATRLRPVEALRAL
jgi:putative ABC transport system permease protein